MENTYRDTANKENTRSPQESSRAEEYTTRMKRNQQPQNQYQKLLFRRRHRSPNNKSGFDMKDTAKYNNSSKEVKKKRDNNITEWLMWVITVVIIHYSQKVTNCCLRTLTFPLIFQRSGLINSTLKK